MTNANADPPDTSDRDPIMDDAGQKLKKARERLGLRYRDVEEASLRIAAHHRNDEYGVGISRLSDIENKGTTPTIYRLYSLCAIYRMEFPEVLSWYGIRLADLFTDARALELEHTHLYNFDADVDAETSMPFIFDPGLDLKRTVFLSRVIQKWGKLPLALLSGMELKDHRYAFVGTEDWTMYPILLPGSLLLIDEARTEIANTGWTNEYERPIYFFEHRGGYVCSWCSRVGSQLILQPHPLSEVEPMVFDSDEIDIIGRVDGVAMRINLSRRRRTRP